MSICARTCESSFEDAFASYCGSTNCAGVNSGTSALHLALLAAGVGPGDEVITVPYTFVATVAAIRYTGATPVFVDVEPKTLTMDVRLLSSALSPRTKAVMPVHLYGHPADIGPIMDFAEQHGLAVIEDAAQAHGSSYQARPVGSFGDARCLSFYPGKNLGAFGEGGAVVSRDVSFHERVCMMRDWGMKEKYHHEVIGFNYRMEGIQGAVLNVKLKHLEYWTEKRRALATAYQDGLPKESLILPVEKPDCRHVYHIYAVRHPDRDGLMQQLAAKGIQTGLHYPIPVHLQPAHADLGYKAGDFPVSEEAAHTVLSLPLYPEMPAEHIERVCEVMRELVG